MKTINYIASMRIRNMKLEAYHPRVLPLQVKLRTGVGIRLNIQL
jgi:hypothetical protein